MNEQTMAELANLLNRALQSTTNTETGAYVKLDFRTLEDAQALAKILVEIRDDESRD